MPLLQIGDFNSIFVISVLFLALIVMALAYFRLRIGIKLKITALNNQILASIPGSNSEAETKSQAAQRFCDLEANLDHLLSRAETEATRRTGQVAILREIAKCRPISQTLSMLCDLVEKEIPGARCSALILGSDGKTVRQSIAPSLPEHYNKALIGLQIGPQVGSCGAAMFLREPVIISDIASHPNWAPFKDLALPCGLRACWSMPAINREGKVLGAFAIYNLIARPPSSEEILIGEIAVELSMIAVDLALTHERLTNQALRDELTQLPNRRYVAKWLMDKGADRNKSSPAIAILLIDLDDFKPVNDTFGHLAGDEVLRKVAERLRLNTRKEDIVARVGGDEFLIILARDDPTLDASVIATEIIDRVAQPITLSGGDTVSVGCSIGITYTDNWSQPRKIFAEVDRAMYLAKANGKNRYEYNSKSIERLH